MPSDILKITGIDPGLAATGAATVRGKGMQILDYSFETISTSKAGVLPERLETVYSRIRALLNREKPDLMVIEDVFSLEKYPKSGITLGKVSGVILLASHQSSVPVIEISVREAKQILTGNGNAGKEQLEKAVRHLLNSVSPIKPSHASDAMSLALIGLFRHQRTVPER